VLPDFSGKLYPSQIYMVGWTVSSTSQKGKTVLFKIKILIKVNLKMQVTKSTTGKGYR
jgi:hypothetical protein